MTAPSLTIAENMADLIDGYCRLVNGASQSFIIRPQKGEHLCPLARSRRVVRRATPQPGAPFGDSERGRRRVTQPSVCTVVFPGKRPAPARVLVRVELKEAGGWERCALCSLGDLRLLGKPLGWCPGFVLFSVSLLTQ